MISNRRRFGPVVLTPLLFLIILNISPAAAEDDAVIKKDPFLKGRYTIHDKSGAETGYMKKDPFSEGRYDVFDDQGRRKGSLERDAVIENRYIYRENGEERSSIRQDAICKERYNVFDEGGKQEGYCDLVAFVALLGDSQCLHGLAKPSQCIII